MIGKRLCELRNEKGMTQGDLAKALQITRSALSLYELDRRDPDTTTVSQIADFFNVNTDYLLGRTTVRTPYDQIIPTIAADRKDGYDKPLTEDEKAMIDSVLEAYRKSKQSKKD